MAALLQGLARRSLCCQLVYGAKRSRIVQQGLCLRRLIHVSHVSQSDFEVKMTDSCAKQLKKIMEKDEFLRIIIEGGGCSGFQYKFEVDSSLEEDDRIFEKDGGKIVVDNDSLALIDGATIDYQIELIKSGFAVQKNPNADKGCSCGSSFSVKI